jgi:rare lipoprotein A
MDFIARFAAAFVGLVPMQHGLASVYDEGRKITACGEWFNRAALTAAHRTLPCGSRIRVWRGDRSVVVRVNDRGPFVVGRIVDLTPAAAMALGFDGLADVSLERM